MLITGISTSAGALRTGQRRMDALSNNIANADTPGFRAEDADTGFVANALQGPIEETGRPLDLALNGSGYFQVRTPTGQVALTRGGPFTTDASGQIVTPNGDALMPPMRLPAGTDPSAVSIAANGTLSVNGSPLGAVSVVDVPAPPGLIALGGGLYAPSVASGPARPTTGAQVVQGVLEGSTTDPIDSMVGLIGTQDTFALNVKAIQAQDEMLRAALNIGPGPQAPQS